MASLKPTRSQSGLDEDDAFGWQLFHDRQRNLVYYLHSYTGEVRWPRPETVGFVMHGLKPLPAHAGVDSRPAVSIVNPDIWSPYYPHVVMLPSGLVQVHPGPGSEAQNATEMWCGYNRFPLRDYATLPEQHSAQEFDRAALISSGPRVLPPTWENSRNGSPFLPPYPVAVLGRDDAEKKHQDAPKPPLGHLDERFQTPEIDLKHSYHQLQSSELGRVQGSMDWPTLSLNPSTSTAPTIPVTSRKQPAFPKGFPAPNTEKKEHNRKGYLLRQARKLMRDSSSSSTTATPNASTAALPKPRKPQDVPPAAKTRHEHSSRRLEDKQDVFAAYEEFEAISPLHC